jgi:hypothetical protein
VGLAVDLVTLGKTLTEDEGIRQGRPSGCDVDWTTSSEVERREVEKPAVGLELNPHQHLVCCGMK